MSAGPFTVYTNAALGMSQGRFNLALDGFSMILATNSYVPASSDATYASVSPNEVADAGGYSTGGLPISNLSDLISGSTIQFTFAPVIWAALSAIFRFAVIVRRGAAALVPTDLLLCYADCSGGGSITGNGGSLTVTPNPAGVFTIAHSP